MIRMTVIAISISTFPAQSPKESAPEAHSSSAPASIAVPDRGAKVEMADWGGRPVVEAEVEGRGKLRLHVDTGTGASLILLPDAARRMGLESPGTSGADPADLAPTGTIASLKIGEAVFRGVPTSVMDFMPSGVERAIDGIIGLPCFSSCLLTLDYAAHRIEITKGAITLDMPGAIAYRRDEAMGGAIDIPVRAGGVEIRVHVDTGSPEILLVSEDLRGTIPLLGEPVFAGRARTPMGDADLWAADLDGDLEIGALRITKPKVRIGDLPQIAGRKLGNIGSAALSQARLTVDVANARVRIEPGEAEAPPGTQVVKNDRPYRVGILAVPGQDELLVQSVVPGGAGEKAGLRAGDRIVAIARENGDAIPLMEAMKAFGSPEPVRVTFLRDTERIVATLQPLPAGK